MFSMDLGSLLVHIRADTVQYLAALKRTETAMMATSHKLQAMGTKMSLWITAPVVGIGVASVKSFSSFDDAMTKSLAIMKGITPEIRASMEATASAISKESVNSSTDLAKAYFYLASAGLDAAQSQAALSAVDRMSVAGNFDLSKATEMVAGSQAALGLTSKDAAQNLKEMIHVSDVLVGANYLAQATTEQFAEALSNEAAAAMRFLNISLEEGMSVLAAYAKQNTRGAEAGSSFSRMLRMMAQGFQENRGAWKKFGVSMYTTTGKIRPLADIIEDLTKVMEPLSDQSKAAALDMLGFKARSQQVIKPLLGMADTIRGYRKELDAMGGVSQEIANKNMQSFAAQLKITWHYVGSLSKQIGRTLAPYITKLGVWVRNATESWNSLDEALKKQIIHWALLAAMIGPVLLIFSKMVAAGAYLIGSFVVLQFAIQALLSPISLVIMSILGLIAIIYAVRAAWKQNIMGLKTIWEYFLIVIQQGIDYLASTVFGRFLIWLGKAWKNAFLNILSNGKEFAKHMSGMFAGAWAYLTNMFDGNEKAVEEWAQAYLDGYDAADAFLKKANDLSMSTFESISASLKPLMDDSEEAWGGLWKSIKNQLGDDMDSLLKLLKVKFPKMAEVAEKAVADLKAAMSAVDSAATKTPGMQLPGINDEEGVNTGSSMQVSHYVSAAGLAIGGEFNPMVEQQQRTNNILTRIERNQRDEERL
jgi:TP901 family phage tail tape measure protein